MTSRYAPEDYADAARALLPRGAVWPNDPDSEQGRAMLALAQTFARNDAAAMQLLVDAFPATTFNLLPEWEESLGLPDPCAGPNPTIEQRQAQVVARFIGGGGQSRAFFIAFAKALGFTIEIQNFAPFRVGHSRIGDALCTEDSVFVWKVNILASDIDLSNRYFRVGHSTIGDPLKTASALDVLECEFGRLKAAETDVIFSD